MWEDRQLLRGLRRGDQAAVGRIYEKYKDDLLAVACCLLLDRGMAGDCLHDVFVRFAARRENGAGISRNLKGYLLARVANQARQLLRQRSRAPRASVDGLLEVLAPAGSSAAEQAVAREEAGRLYRALDQLPHEQRETVSLHLRGQMTFRQIARQQLAALLVPAAGRVDCRNRQQLDREVHHPPAAPVQLLRRPLTRRRRQPGRLFPCHPEAHHGW